MHGKRQGFVLAIMIVMATVAVVSRSDRASGQTDIHVLTPVGGGGRSSIIDVVRGPDLNIGDGVAGRGPLVDPVSGEDAGSLYFECTVMRKIRGPETGLWRCNDQLKLPEGDIVLQGLDPRGPGASTFAVLGGTGAYRGASGDAVFTDSDAGTDIVITLA